MKNIFFKTIFLVSLLSAFSCSEEMMNERLLVDASGKPGELFVVMDSIQWKGELGELIKSSVISNVPGLPQNEPYFKVHYIEPTQFKSFLRNVTNILFVATLDSKTKGGAIVRSYITKKYIVEHPQNYLLEQKDLFAKGQSVLYLFGADQHELANRMAENESFIRNFFNQKEKERLKQRLYKSKEKKGINNTLLKKHDFYMRIPNGYRIEADEPGFVWIRLPDNGNRGIDKNIFVTSTAYVSEDAFKKSEIIAWRDDITRDRIFEDPEMKGSYMETDTVNIHVEYNSATIGGNFAKEIRGIWRTHTKGIGGTYLSYVVLDNESNRIFYIDGFVVSPGVPKRESMRELETILSTFRTTTQMESLASKN
ncbi:MAG: DUF4837 family protein [Cyclobacteriaceae bacterium]|nr:DUF4837 family protein [Cyclobacteriaceae bacterium]